MNISEIVIDKYYTTNTTNTIKEPDSTSDPIIGLTIDSISTIEIDQIYYPITNITKEEFIIYNIENLYFTNNKERKELTINYILNIPLQYLSDLINIKSNFINKRIKLYFSFYDDYLFNYLSPTEIKILKRVDFSYLGKDVKYFPLYILKCINDKKVNSVYKCILLQLINCKEIKIEKRLEIYNSITLLNINIGNILLKLIKEGDEFKINSVTFSSIYQIM
jgi:hypothetical protein